LEAEILILRHQLNIQRRHVPNRVAFSAVDRLMFVGLYRLVPNTLKALTPASIHPATPKWFGFGRPIIHVCHFRHGNREQPNACLGLSEWGEGPLGLHQWNAVAD
jgi:hypothetical protein